MKKDIAIYGAGGLGREVALLIAQINEAEPQWNLIGFFDDHLKIGIEVDGLPILGGIHESKHWNTPLAIALAVSHAPSKEKIYNNICANPRLTYPPLIHPSVNQGDIHRNSWGKGILINAGSIFTTSIRLGDFVLINLMCTIGHDVEIGDYSSVMPGCHISGNVNVGKSCLLGTGSKILQNLTLGDQCIIGAGAVVTKNAHAGTTLVGIPAKEMINSN